MESKQKIVVPLYIFYDKINFRKYNIYESMKSYIVMHDTLKYVEDQHSLMIGSENCQTQMI